MLKILKTESFSTESSRLSVTQKGPKRSPFNPGPQRKSNNRSRLPSLLRQIQNSQFFHPCISLWEAREPWENTEWHTNFTQKGPRTTDWNLQPSTNDVTVLATALPIPSYYIETYSCFQVCQWRTQTWWTMQHFYRPKKNLDLVFFLIITNSNNVKHIHCCHIGG